MSDVWGSEAREAVADAIQDGMNDAYPNPWCGCGSINRAADAVLAALTAHAIPRTAVLDLAQQWESDPWMNHCAAELRALAGDV